MLVLMLGLVLLVRGHRQPRRPQPGHPPTPEVRQRALHGRPQPARRAPRPRALPTPLFPGRHRGRGQEVREGVEVLLLLRSCRRSLRPHRDVPAVVVAVDAAPRVALAAVSAPLLLALVVVVVVLLLPIVFVVLVGM